MKIPTVLMGTILLSFATISQAQDAKLTSRLNASVNVIEDIMHIPDRAIPNSILRAARCVVVVPSYKKGAFLVGAQYGQGVATCRTARGWSAPAFVSLSGGSFGFQAGGQATDLVLVAMNQRGLEEMLKSKFKIGGDAAASAGPVGRNAQAGTDWKLNAEFLTYSRSKGLFAGVDLDGTVLLQNQDDTRTEYGSMVPFEAILHGKVPAQKNSRGFLSVISRYFSTGKARE